MKSVSLRKAIDEHCKQCVVDPCSPGTWRQQVSLCNVTGCPLWRVRPKSTSTIPESVLRWYGVENAEFQGLSGTFD